MFGDIIRTHTDAMGTIDESKVLDETIANLVGGSETTIVLMAWALLYLVQEPRIAERMYEEIDCVLGRNRPTPGDLKRLPYLHYVVSETLRLRPPAYVSSRMVSQDTELGGYSIPKGAMLFFCQYLTHRDPGLWSEPERFIPERFAPDSLEAPSNRRTETVFFPFGGGALTCLGMNYAFYEAELMLLMLLQHFRFTPVQPENLSQVGIDARLTLRPDRPVLLRAHIREPRRHLAAP
jgi:pentalenene oxygenase